MYGELTRNLSSEIVPASVASPGRQSAQIEKSELMQRGDDDDDQDLEAYLITAGIVTTSIP